ncbi:MAG: YihY/virulence factor BrkB family protein [Gracilibacteraceae bacterium]|nr:YihY/virulence factor BrkB family protein [Gracilibacteraceae bacterium]
MIMKHVRIFFTNFQDIIRSNDLFALGGQITYYALLSIFPLLLSALNILSYFSPLISLVGDADFFAQLEQVIPENFAGTVVAILQEMVSQRNIAVISIGTLTSIWAASKGIGALLRPLHGIYQIPRPGFIKVKALAMIFYLIFVAALMMSFLSGGLGDAVTRLLALYLGEGHVFSLLWENVRLLFGLVLLAAVSLLLNKLVTGANYTLRKLIPGALLSAAGWVALSLGFSAYVHYANNYSIVYGSLAGVMLLMLWLYWSAEILLFGAVLNVVLEGSYTPEGLTPNKPD